MTMLAGWLANSLRSTYNYSAGYNVCSYLFMQTRDYAARKGTRERREKLKKKRAKVIVEKIGFIPHNKRDKVVKKAVSPLTLIDDSSKWMATDNVYVVNNHRQPVYTLQEAIECHREMHHPTMMNTPDTPINAFVELDLRREKKTRFVESFTNVIDTPHIFKYSESDAKILVFCKSPQEQENARNSGADYVGGIDTIKQIQNGEFLYKEYNHILAHPDIITELLLIRGLLRRKFPNLKSGTLSNKIDKAITKFRHGIQYTAIPDALHKDYGQVDVIFGLLDMDTTQLEENFHALINDIESHKPKREGDFIQRVQIKSNVSNESFKIDFKQFLPVPDVEEETIEPDNTAIISTQ